MAKSRGQMETPICSKCCKNRESSQRYADTACQSASMMTERNTSNAAHAVLSRRLHLCAAAPSSLQNKVASTNPTMATPTIVLPFREYMYCAVIPASVVLLLPRRRSRGHKIDRFSLLFGRHFPRVTSLLTFPTAVVSGTDGHREIIKK